MKYCFEFSIVLFLACLLLVPTSEGQAAGTISGIVVDENGVPVANAKINADPVDDRSKGSLVRYVETDANGHFLINRLAWGRYKVFAKKEEAGYPDMRWSFYSNDSVSLATVAPNMPAATIRLHFGPKGGFLTGSIASAANGGPVNGGFKLSRATDPDKWISTSVPPAYQVLLPPSTEVLLEVSAPGFETWTPGHSLRLASGEEMRLDIRLKPSHDSNLHPSKFLIPDGYVGWLFLEFNVKDAQPAPTENVVKIFKFPASGALSTSSSGPESGAEDKYFYYSPDGSLREISTDYGHGKGMVWGGYQGSREGVMSLFGVFVGSEEQYKKYQSQAGHPGQILLT